MKGETSKPLSSHTRRSDFGGQLVGYYISYSLDAECKVCCI